MCQLHGELLENTEDAVIAFQEYAPGVLAVVTRLNKVISYTLDEMALEAAKIIRKLSVPDDYLNKPKYSSALKLVLVEGFDLIAEQTAEGIKQAQKIGLDEQTESFLKTSLQTVDQTEWLKYIKTTQKIINLDTADFLKEKSRIDGTTLKFKLKTVRKSTESAVDLIVNKAIEDGISAFDLAKQIDNFIKRDKRQRWVSPYTLAKRADGKISKEYDGKIRTGSVDYNAFRIARTELASRYREAIVNSTENAPWKIGWKWSLSSSHKVQDICDTWAGTDNGYGKGVYTSSTEILSFGHPFCFCNVSTVTVYSKEMEPYFKKAYKDLGKELPVQTEKFLRAAQK